MIKDKNFVYTSMKLPFLTTNLMVYTILHESKLKLTSKLGIRNEYFVKYLGNDSRYKFCVYIDEIIAFFNDKFNGVYHLAKRKAF